MADLVTVVVAFSAALGLLGIAIALWLFLDGLRARRQAARYKAQPDRR